ncbi:MAG: glycosyltransferase family 2 protein [Nitrososphaerota archaeon]|nr:glycosyltransferase family 2 protein [Nitrososphaerota archaeon]
MSRNEIPIHPENFSKGLVSVVIPCYFLKGKSVNLLSNCITSVLGSTYKKIEVIVVDDGSPVDFASMLDSDLLRRVTLISNWENRGYGYACNEGAKRAGGEFVCFLNDDMKVKVDAIEILVRLLYGNPQIGIIACKEVEYESTTKVRSAGMLMDRFMNTYARRPTDPPVFFYAPGSPSFMKHEVFTAVGGFDDEYYLYAEDVDLSWRVRLRGYRIVYEDSAIVYHLGSATLGRFTARRVYFTQKNSLRTLLKNSGASMLLKSSVLFHVQSVFLLIFALLQGWNDMVLAVARSMVENTKDFPRVWKKRMIVQYFRRVDDSIIASYMFRGWLLTVGKKLSTYRRRL